MPFPNKKYMSKKKPGLVKRETSHMMDEEMPDKKKRKKGLVARP